MDDKTIYDRGQHSMVDNGDGTATFRRRKGEGAKDPGFRYATAAVYEEITKLREALKEVTEEYIAGICNSEKMVRDEVCKYSDVKRWLDLAKGEEQ